VHLVEQVEQGGPARGVEADERLVDEQQGERTGQAEQQRCLLAQAAAEPAGQVVEPVAEAESLGDPLGVVVEAVAPEQALLF